MVFAMVAKYFSADLAINLGTANTVIYTKHQGVLAHEPSVIALQERRTGSHVALNVGQSAKEMIGRTSENVNIVRPLHEGVVADSHLTQMMLKHCLQHVTRRNALRQLRCILSIPAGSSAIEKRAVVEAAHSAGIRQVYLIDEPIASALGEDIDIREPYGRMVVDIGGGTTNITIMSVGGLVYNHTLRLGSEAMDEAIVQELRRQYDLAIGLQMAEQLKIDLGNALPHSTPQRRQIEGTDAMTRTPRLQKVTSHDVREALIDIVHMMINAMRDAFERTPPELLADIT